MRIGDIQPNGFILPITPERKRWNIELMKTKIKLVYEDNFNIDLNQEYIAQNKELVEYQKQFLN